MAELKVTSLVKHITKPMSGLSNILPVLALLLFFMFSSGQLFADEQTDVDYQFTGVLLANAALLYSQDGDIGYNPDDTRSIYNSNDESIRFIAAGHLGKNFTWEAQYLNQRFATDFPTSLGLGNPDLFRIKSSRHYFVQDTTGEHQTTWHHEIDRLYTKYEYDNASYFLGQWSFLATHRCVWCVLAH
jgi:hypothetical protein